MRKSKVIAINAILAALILIFSAIPIMPIGVDIAVLTLIPVFIAGQVAGWRSALFAGFFLGMMSFITSFISPSPLAPVFRNPMVSLVPRMLVGLVVWLVYNLVHKGLSRTKLKPALAHTIASSTSAGLAVITNTALVLSMIWAFYNGNDIGGTAITPTFMMSLVTVNFVIEIVGAIFFTPPISYAVRRSLYKSNYKPAPPIVVETEESNNASSN